MTYQIPCTFVFETYILAAPSISSFNPRTGIHGAIVTIFGSNFGPSSAPRKAFIGKSECKDISTVQDFQGLSCSLSVGTGANLPIVVSVGGQEGSSTPLFFTYSAPKISSVDKVQSPSSGSINANVFGFQFGDGQTIPRLSFGGTSQMMSFWTSITSVVSRLPAGNQQSGFSFIVRLSTESQSGSMTLPWLFISPQTAASTNLSNIAASGSIVIQVSGNNFGSLADPTIRLKFGIINMTSSSYLSTHWISDSSAACKPGSGLHILLRVSVSVGSAVSETANVWAFNQPTVFHSSLFALGPTSGSISVSIIGSGFGTNDQSPRSQLGIGLNVNAINATLSSCEESKWSSQSAIHCKMHQGTNHGTNYQSFVIISVESKTKLHPTDSKFNKPSVSEIQKATKTPKTGSCIVTITGISMSTNAYSEAARVGRGAASEGDTTGGTACEASRWTSSSSAVCKAGGGVGGGARGGQGLPVVVSAGLQSGSLTRAWSYDAAEVSAAGGASNGPSSGSVSVSVAGQGLGSRGCSGAASEGDRFRFYSTPYTTAAAAAAATHHRVFIRRSIIFLASSLRL